MRRICGISCAALTALTLGACKDVGLQGNVPLAKAENAAPEPLVQQTDLSRPVLPPGTPTAIELDSTTWTLDGTAVDIADTELRSVGSAAGQSVYALRWDEPPYDVLMTRLPDGQYQKYRQVIGR